ncbi:MAG: exported protein of unknown function [Candidatus Thorarchaeota archaeon]|nr:MAG: exported protein of unknown function [Candidatus Thorarchaeota archaeon]
MKRAFLSIMAIVLLTVTIASPQFATHQNNLETASNPLLKQETVLSSVVESGDEISSIQHMIREIPNQQTTILNSYVNPNTHNLVLDFSQYHVPGWSLYKADMDIENITAGLEFEVLGVSKDDSTSFSINNDTGDPYDILSQGFYNQPHNGLLQNYSFYYQDVGYNPDFQNYAFSVIRSDRSNPSTNMTSPVALSTTSLAFVWRTITEQTNLSAYTTYYTLIDGEALVEYTGNYPDFHWVCESGAGDFNTERHYSFGDQWTIFNREALLNYTYTPWNVSTNSALIFQNPEEILLQANSSDLSGSMWSWTTSTDNLEQITFSSNQSVNIFNNLTLYYKQTVTSTTQWSIETTGDPVTWNVTTALSYPEVTGITEKNLNISIQSDWDTSGLYNITTPSTNHSTYERYLDIVVCSSLTNGTWTLVSTGFNYMTDLAAYQQSDHLNPVSVSVITDTLDIISQIEDEGGTNATTGSTNLTIWYEGSVIWAPTNESVIDGSTEYTWDISTITSGNGEYTIEEYWTNGTEAGYRAYSIVVYFPTDLTPSSSTIFAYAENSFTFSVQFDDTFTPKGLNDSVASVEYSFDGGVYTAMTHDAGGNWSATVSTIGKTEGSYNLIVNATGFALENQSITISVELVYETLALECTWSLPNEDNISYLENTELTVRYQTTGYNISDAIVNVTIDVYTWDLTFDATTETYKVQVNGTDFQDGLGTFPVTIEAWSPGHAPQTNTSLELTIMAEATSMTDIWTGLSIDYLGQVDVTIDYTIVSTASEVPMGEVVGNITIDGTTVISLTQSGTQWIANLTGATIDLGTHTAVIHIWAYGYQYRTASETLDVSNVTTSIDVSWTPLNLTRQYSGYYDVVVDYTYYGGDVPGSALVNVTINGQTFGLSYSTGAWRVSIAASNLDIGEYSASISAWLYGYAHQTNTTSTLNITLANTTIVTNWSNYDLYFTHSVDLNITLLDIYAQPITTALVNASYEGTNYTLSYLGGGTHRLVFNGSDGLGTYPIQIYTWNYGFYNETTSITLNIVQTPTSIDASTKIQGYSESILYHDGKVTYSVLFEDIDSNRIDSALVNFTIDGIIYNMTALGNGNYTISFDGEDLGVGSFAVELHAWKYGYAPQTLTPTIVVNPNPTYIEIIEDTETTIFLNDTRTVRVRYIDNHTGMILSIDTEYISWPGTISYNNPSAGEYEIEFSTFYTLGNHILNVTLVKENYTIGQKIWEITIRPVNTIFIPIGEYTEYENESITFSANYTDIDHHEFIYWGNVSITIDGVTYQLEYTTSGIYSRTIPLTIEDGDYTITFEAIADGCATNTTYVLLNLLTKTDVQLVLEVPNTATEGNTIGIQAILTDAVDNPITFATVTFSVDVRFENGTVRQFTYSDTTNANGEANWAYVVPDGGENRVNSLTVNAYYDPTVDNVKSNWDASASAVEISVSLPWDRQLVSFALSREGLMIIGILLIVGAVATYYNKSVKPKRFAETRALEKQLSDFKDLEGLQHFMAVYLDRGTCVFYHPFTETRIQPDLISGFIAAITSVYGEIKGDGVQGTLEEINYHGLKLNSYSGKYVIGILIVEGDMTPLLRDRLQWFVELFEQQYDADLDGWMGVMDCFNPEWIVSNLHAAFNYHWLLPHRVGDITSISKKDAKYLEVIVENLDEKGEIRLQDVIEPLAERMNIDDFEVLEYLLNMTDRQVLVPISINIVLQRKGLGLGGASVSDDLDDYEEVYIDETDPEVETTPDPDTEETLDVVKEPIESDSEIPTPEEGIEEVELDKATLLETEEEKDTEMEKISDQESLDFELPDFTEDELEHHQAPIEDVVQEEEEPEAEVDPKEAFASELIGILSKEKKKEKKEE